MSVPKTTKIYLEIQATHTFDMPVKADIQAWIAAATSGFGNAAELCVRVVDEDESAALNEKYRHKQGPTNILSFPFEAQTQDKVPYLGDLVVCAPLLVVEAAEQHKPLFHHWAHIIVHGVLHLMGHDHEDDDEALQMETKEIRILEGLGIGNPYHAVTPAPAMN